VREPNIAYLLHWIAKNSVAIAASFCRGATLSPAISCSSPVGLICRFDVCIHYRADVCAIVIMVDVGAGRTEGAS